MGEDSVEGGGHSLAHLELCGELRHRHSLVARRHLVQQLLLRCRQGSWLRLMDSLALARSRHRPLERHVLPAAPLALLLLILVCRTRHVDLLLGLLMGRLQLSQRILLLFGHYGYISGIDLALFGWVTLQVNPPLQLGMHIGLSLEPYLEPWIKPKSREVNQTEHRIASTNPHP